MQPTRMIMVLIVAAGLMLLSGCAYVNVKSPLDVDLEVFSILGIWKTNRVFLYGEPADTAASAGTEVPSP